MKGLMLGLLVAWAAAAQPVDECAALGRTGEGDPSSGEGEHTLVVFGGQDEKERGVDPLEVPLGTGKRC